PPYVLLSVHRAPPHHPPLRSLYSHRAHRALPSFPTRRSSDLHASPRGSSAVFAVPVPASGSGATLYFSSLAFTTGSARLEKYKVDRKSTRLNSSHQIISYAVFCLKKKTETQ